MPVTIIIDVLRLSYICMTSSIFTEKSPMQTNIPRGWLQELQRSKLYWGKPQPQCKCCLYRRFIARSLLLLLATQMSYRDDNVITFLEL